MLENLLSNLTECNIIKSDECGEIIEQHKCFLKHIQSEHKEEFENYDIRKSIRLDTFLQTFIINMNYKNTKFWNLIKTVNSVTWTGHSRAWF